MPTDDLQPSRRRELKHKKMRKLIQRTQVERSISWFSGREPIPVNHNLYDERKLRTLCRRDATVGRLESAV